MYNVGDVLIYGINGLYKFTAKTELPLNKEIIEYFILEPLDKRNSTVYVPVNNTVLTTKLRYPYDKSKIETILSEALPADWIDDENKRKKLFRQMLNTGDITEIVKVIKILIIKKQELESVGKHLRQQDEKMLNDSLSPLIQEIDFVCNSAETDALKYIESFLKTE